MYVNMLQRCRTQYLLARGRNLRQINPDFNVHCVYRMRSHFIPEHLRIAFTRFRLSSHRLRVETGRWSRLPREQRLCDCGEIQDEQHVLTICPLVENLRDQYGDAVVFPQFLQCAESQRDFKLVFDILHIIEGNR